MEMAYTLLKLSFCVVGYVYYHQSGLDNLHRLDPLYFDFVPCLNIRFISVTII